MTTAPSQRALVTASLLAGLSSVSCVGEIGDPSGGLGNHPEIGPDGRYICDNGPYPAQSFARRLSVDEYNNVIRDLFGGTVAPSTRYPGSYGKSLTGYSTEPQLYTVGDQTTESLMFAAEDVAEDLAGTLGSVLPCAASAPTDDCAAQFIDTFATRAYRRPLADDERQRLLTEYQEGRASGANFDEAIAMTTAHILQSPQFLYVVEAAAADGRQLDGYEIASRMSFYLWETLPDDELLGLAASGDLTKSSVRRAQAERMLADARAEAVFKRFFREWTETEDVGPGDKDPNLVPGFDAAYAASMAESFDRFSIDQARNGTLSTLLTGQSVWVDERMASFFGAPAPEATWEQVTLDDRYSGLVTQPLFLASAAHYADTSYVFRGRFVRKRLLCANLGAPPGDAQAQFEAAPKPADPTGKELSASIASNSTCASCHSRIDPGGLSLENFGALGQWRDSYPSGKSIDPSGVLTSVGETGDIEFTSYRDLFDKLAHDPEVAKCFGRQVVRFAMSREDTQDDGCAAQNAGDLVAGGDGEISAALVDMAASDSFGYRRD